MEPVGIIPCAGVASRISPLPCSKEIYPLGFLHEKTGKKIKTRVACHWLLESMAIAEASKAYMIIRAEKWDIPAFLGNGNSVGLNLAYLVTDRTLGVPFTVDGAFPFVNNNLILFGFPDIIFNPKEAFIRLLERHKLSGADIVLGLFRAHNPDTADMVSLDSIGCARDIIIKPKSTKLEYAWIIALWTNVFTHFMHVFLSRTTVMSGIKKKELHIGDVILAWIKDGLSVETVIFEDGNYLDIGTPEGMAKVLKGNF